MADTSLDFLPISERQEWADVRPLVPPATPQPVVAIGRDLLLGELMDYFWAAVAAKECSERVLALTGEIIADLNSSNYSVWEWRWRCLQALGGVEAHAAGERQLMRSVATANPKNYQLWNHRRRVALALGPGQAEEEMEFAAACLAYDAKNYHAWAHRQALLDAWGAVQPGLGLWGAELAYTERLLRDDVRNNSAWNQRIFVLCAAPLAAGLGAPGEAHNREVDFAAAKLRLAPHNEAAWEALRSLAAAGGESGGAPGFALAADPRYLGLCREVLAAAPACPPALALLADVLLEQAALLRAALDYMGASSGSGSGSGGDTATAGQAPGMSRRAGEAAAAEARRLARRVLERLAVADPIRRPFLAAKLAALG